jgi:hypothetical protein
MRTAHRILISEEYIAEAQRRAIAQNALLRLVYQTRWVRWLAHVIFLACFLLAAYVPDLRPMGVLFGGLLVVSIAGEIYGRRSLARARGRVRAKGTITMLTMDEQGIEASGALAESRFKWDAVLERAVYPDGVLVKFSRLNMVWLPDSALVEGSPADVRELLRANVQA